MDDNKYEAFDVWPDHESYDLSSKDINVLISCFGNDFQGACGDEEDYACESFSGIHNTTGSSS